MNNIPMKAFSARVRGIVQGVGFRYATVFEAQRLNIRGFVRNASNGAVEVTAEGPADKIDQFQAWLNHGPAGAVVREVAIESRVCRGQFDRFTIEY
jgi:acylphosphatase